MAKTPTATTTLIGDYLEINLVGRSESGKTFTWSVVNRKHKIDLGVIYWHSPWRQYVFAPIDETIYSAGCMTDIAEFMEKHR